MSTSVPTFEVYVDGMTCDHCKRAVTSAVQSLPTVVSVTVDLATGRVFGTGAVERDSLVEVIEEEGYSVRD